MMAADGAHFYKIKQRLPERGYHISNSKLITTEARLCEVIRSRVTLKLGMKLMRPFFAIEMGTPQVYEGTLPSSLIS